MRKNLLLALLTIPEGEVDDTRFERLGDGICDGIKEAKSPVISLDLNLLMEAFDHHEVRVKAVAMRITGEIIGNEAAFLDIINENVADQKLSQIQSCIQTVLIYFLNPEKCLDENKNEVPLLKDSSARAVSCLAKHNPGSEFLNYFSYFLAQTTNWSGSPEDKNAKLSSQLLQSGMFHGSKTIFKRVVDGFSEDSRYVSVACMSIACDLVISLCESTNELLRNQEILHTLPRMLYEFSQQSSTEEQKTALIYILDQFYSGHFRSQQLNLYLKQNNLVNCYVNLLMDQNRIVRQKACESLSSLGIDDFSELWFSEWQYHAINGSYTSLAALLSDLTTNNNPAEVSMPKLLSAAEILASFPIQKLLDLTWNPVIQGDLDWDHRMSHTKSLIEVFWKHMNLLEKLLLRDTKKFSGTSEKVLVKIIRITEKILEALSNLKINEKICLCMDILGHFGKDWIQFILKLPATLSSSPSNASIFLCAFHIAEMIIDFRKSLQELIVKNWSLDPIDMIQFSAVSCLSIQTHPSQILSRSFHTIRKIVDIYGERHASVVTQIVSNVSALCFAVEWEKRDSCMEFLSSLLGPAVSVNSAQYNFAVSVLQEKGGSGQSALQLVFDKVANEDSEYVRNSAFVVIKNTMNWPCLWDSLYKLVSNSRSTEMDSLNGNSQLLQWILDKLQVETDEMVRHTLWCILIDCCYQSQIAPHVCNALFSSQDQSALQHSIKQAMTFAREDIDWEVKQKACEWIKMLFCQESLFPQNLLLFFVLNGRQILYSFAADECDRCARIQGIESLIECCDRANQYLSCTQKSLFSEEIKAELLQMSMIKEEMQRKLEMEQTSAIYSDDIDELAQLTTTVKDFTIDCV